MQKWDQISLVKWPMKSTFPNYHVSDKSGCRTKIRTPTKMVANPSRLILSSVGMCNTAMSTTSDPDTTRDIPEKYRNRFNFL